MPVLQRLHLLSDLRWTVTGFGAVALLAGLALWAAPAAAQTTGCLALSADRDYRIQNRNSNFFLEPAGTEVGDEVIQQPQDPDDSGQTWRFVAVEGGVQIINGGTGLAAATAGGATAARTTVVQATPDAASANQVWAVEDGPPGYCRFRHVESGLTLRLASKDAGREAFIDVLEEAFHSQQWTVTEVGTGTGLPEPPAGERLRTLAAQLGVPVGSAVNPFALGEPAYDAVLAREFDTAVCETTMKPGQVSTEEGAWEWGGADACRDYVVENDLRYHGHALIMIGAARASNIPTWWEGLTPTAFETAFDFHVDTVATRYADAVDVWHVVNEAVERGGGFREWQGTEVFGYRDGVPNYIIRALEIARAADPTATLLYTEGFLSQNDPAMLATILDMLTKFKAWGVPIDGVGLQMHTASTDNDHALWVGFANDVAALGYEFHITEHDVSIPSEVYNETTAAEQAEVYRSVLDAFLALPNRGDYVLWGYTDKHSWRHPDRNGAFLYPLPFDVEYQPKPAYAAMQGAFRRAVPNEAGPAPRAEALRIENVHPNPSVGGVRFTVRSPTPGPFDLTVYDVLGRVLLSTTLAEAGVARLPADALSAGSYFLRVSSAGGETSATARFTIGTR